MTVYVHLLICKLCAGLDEVAAESISLFPDSVQLHTHSCLGGALGLGSGCWGCPRSRGCSGPRDGCWVIVVRLGGDVLQSPSCLITRLGKTSVLPKWLMRGSPPIPAHPMVIGPLGLQRAAHKNYPGYIVKRPHGLSHKGFNITTAFYRLEDDLGNCPVYEIRGMRKQEGPEDEKEEPVAGVALIGISEPALRAFGSHGLGVSTFLWECVTDTCERRNLHLSFYDPKVEGG
ncbi:hypothetical protein CRG98_007515 [Punica granatum]|uniref:Uncharacterized protein n=1 Tax=Punica granatum TaxID=22663 RepID=A0A2I0KUH5_PUNGR|nr:hypothetical protein CRG98_007515 [Punica granatum]